MKRNRVKQGFARPYIFFIAVLLLVVFGVIKPDASEKAVKNAATNPLFGNLLRKSSPQALSDNTLPSMLSRLKELSEKLKQLKDNPTTLTSFMGRKHSPLQPTRASQAALKDNEKTADQKNPFLNALKRGRDASQESRYRPNEILVKFKPFTSSAAFQSILTSMGLKDLKHYKQADVHLVKTAPGTKVEDALKKLQQNPGVLYAEPNYQRRAMATLPNDPDFSLQWSLNNTGQTGGVVDADIDAPEAWDVATGAGDLVIAVIDTGVAYNHVDLAGNIWTNAGEIPGDTIDNDGNGYVDDLHGINAINGSGDPLDDAMYAYYHGTHCAGIIAAKGNNGTGISGVCWSAKIMALKFLDEWGWGSDGDAIECIEYMVNMKNTYGVNVKVASNSWGGDPYGAALKDAIDLAKDSDILFIASAGNDGNNNDLNPVYPASYDCINIVSVAASDHDDALADLGYWASNYGNNTVDVAAPGVDILSTIWISEYYALSGTSMAAPHVAGLAGLIFSHDPGMSYLDVKERLIRTVDQKDTLAGTLVSGGRINAFSALTMDPQGPFIYSIAPPGTHGDRVIIEGAGFGTAQGSGYVTFFDTVTAPVTSWSDNLIETTIPEGCQSGPVTVTTDDGISNEKVFTLSGAISGRVTNENNDGSYATIDLWLHDNTNTFVSSVRTDEKGDYRIVVPAEEYALLVWPLNDCYYPEVYDNINIYELNSLEEATAVIVQEGQETTGIDIQLDLGGSVSGTITDETGNPLPGVEVNVRDSDGYQTNWTWSDPSGHYTVCGLTTGNYYVSTWSEPEYGTTGPDYFNEWYGDTGPCDGDPPVSVIAPEETAGIDFQLAFAWEDGFESDNTCEEATPTPADGTAQEHTLYPLGDEDWIQFEVTEQSGISIELSSLSPTMDASVTLFDTDCETELSQMYISWYDCGPRIAYAMQSPGTYFIKVTGHGNIGKYTINITPIPLGVISGRVFKEDAPTQGIADVRVIAEDYFNYGGYGEVQTDPSGGYSLRLLPGKYLVGVQNDSDLDYPYLEFYKDAYSPYSDKVQLVEVIPDTNTVNIDFGMPRAQSIGGRVAGIDHHEELCIDVMDANSLFAGLDYTCIMGPGDYLVSGLHPGGSYSVAALGSLGYLFYDNALTPLNAKPVTPPRDDIDFDFSFAGCLTGRVTDAATAEPVEYMYVMLFDGVTGKLEALGYLDSSGGYTFDHLPPKRYQVKAFPAVWAFPGDGYCSQRQEAVVGTGGCAEVNFQVSECAIPCMNAGAGEASGRLGQTVTIPLSIENFQDQFFAMEAYLEFDPAKLELTAIRPGAIDATVLHYYPAWMFNLYGAVDVMVYFDVSAQGSGTLVYLDFTILSGEPGEELPLPLYAYPAVCETADGKISILPPCTTNSDCDDGLYCTGAETCLDGICHEGTAPCADDGFFCNGAESCSEANDSCSSSGNPCSPGQVCKEVTDTCETTTTTTRPSTTTTVPATTTVPGEVCTTDGDCADGNYCNGVEVCVGGDCQDGVPVACPDDGTFCNGVENCDEETDSCVSTGNPCGENETCNEESLTCDTLPVEGIECTTNALGSGFMLLPGIVIIKGNDTSFTMAGSQVKYDPPVVMPFFKMVTPATQTITQLVIVLPSVLPAVPAYPLTVTVTVDGFSDEMEVGRFVF